MTFRNRTVIFLALTVLWATGIFIVSSIPGNGLPPNMGYLTNIGHFAEYLVLAVLIALALHTKERALWKVTLAAIIIASLYGASDEFHQLFVEGRYADVFDWLTDTAGAVVGAAVAVFTIRALSCKTKKSNI